jgi:hypothetical protein
MSVRRPGVRYKEGDTIPPSNLPKARVEQYAAQVAAALEFKVGGDHATLVKTLGGRIAYQDLGELLEEGGSVFVHGPYDFDILLPHYTSPVRDRFTVGHEVGHFLLHSALGSLPIVAYRSGSTRIEWEANWFAAALLMPRHEFEAEWRRTHSLPLVAARFGVSPAAAEVRRDALGLR